MGTYRQKPIEFEALRFTGDNWDEVRELAPIDPLTGRSDVRVDIFSNCLLVGSQRCRQGDWLTRNEWVPGDAAYGTCSHEAFELNYEPVEEACSRS